MGFESFPAQSPTRHANMTCGPPCLSRTRTSHPPKCFPPQQPFCVTTSVAFSPFCPHTVSSPLTCDLKALLRCEIRCQWPVLLLASDPILPWALFPFKVLPSSSNAFVKSPGNHPPKQNLSGCTTRPCGLPGCASTRGECLA